MKDKPNSVRVYDEEGYKLRAACVCVRSSEEKEVLLVTSLRHPDRWLVPGGGVEPGENGAVTAVREVYEEAGVVGILGRSLGTFENREHKHRTEVYVLFVTQEVPEWEEGQLGRQRKWFSVDEALNQLNLHKPLQCSYIQQMKRSKQNSYEF